MNDATHDPATDEPALSLAQRDHELRARFEHLRALNATWAVLAPFGISEEGQHIVETGRAVNEELTNLAGQPHDERDHAKLADLDKLLDASQSDMQALAFEVPVGQFRASLPARLAGERRGILDLLDLLLVPEMHGQDSLAGRISAIDYLITLLSTGGDGEVAHDPVGLTPRLGALCQRADAEADPEQEQIAAEFLAAAGLCEEDARDEVGQRALRHRKLEIGGRFFAPSVLRAIVAYNAGLSRCIARGVWDSRDWGSLPGVSEGSAAGGLVFESEALQRLTEALRRRVRSGEPTSSALDRVAWCLDLDALDPPTRTALLAPAAAEPGNLEATAILVGLLQRSSVILAGELPAIGIAPEQLSDAWVGEVDAASSARSTSGSPATRTRRPACSPSCGPGT